MRTQVWLLAAALGMVASAAAAEPDRPRIYYPRNVRRSFFDGNSATTAVTDLPTEPISTTHSSTKRSLLDGLGAGLGGLLGGGSSKPASGTPGDGKAGNQTVPAQSTTSPPKSPPKSSTGGDNGKTGGETGGNGGKDGGKTHHSSIVVAPTGIVSKQGTSETNTTPPPSKSTSQGGNIVGSVLTGLLGDHSTSSHHATSPDSTHPPPKSQPTQSASQPASETNTHKDLPTTHSKPTPTSSHHGILPASSVLGGIFPSSSSSSSSSIETHTHSHGHTDTQTQTASNGQGHTTQTKPPVTQSTRPASVTNSAHSASTTDTPPVVNSTSTDLGTGPVTQTGVVNSTATDGPTQTQTGTSSLPTGVVNGTDTATNAATGTHTGTNTGTRTGTHIGTATVSGTGTASQTNTNNGKSTAIPTTTASHKPVTSIEATATVSNTNTNDWLPSTIVAEATSMTGNPATQTADQTGASSSNSIPTSVPRVILPDNQNPDQAPPADTTLIEIGFFFPLNYVFVAQNPVAAAQIFKFLPQALANGGGFSVDKVMVSKLIPDDTMDLWGYVTTIAQVYYPSTLVQTLQMDLWAPNSGIYNNQDSIVRNLTSVINPKIDIYGNIDGDGSPPAGSGSSDSSTGSNNDPFDNSSSGSGSTSSKQKAMAAGIAVGAVGLCAMYGAAMFIVARRYKRKKQGHTRASSLGGSSNASSEMRYTGGGSPALMGGALMSREFVGGYGGVAGGRDSHGSGRSGAGNSARTANISAPLSAENSLGWN